jgi:NAD+ kinase
MRVAIYSRGLEVEHENPFQLLLQELQKHHIEMLMYKPLLYQHPFLSKFSDKLTPFQLSEELDKDVDFMISLGGDGTILDSIALVQHRGIPILGINFGRLGFLASIGNDELVIAVDALVNGTFVVDKRSLLHLDSNQPIFTNAPFCLNDFSILKRDISPMIKIRTYLNGEFLNTYWADGIIVSTPTGSTGYNMSCNGPILFPESSSFVITPVAPHNLSVRPIVVSDSSIISFEVEGRTGQFICAMDSRREIVDQNIQLAVKKEKFYANLVRLNENSFLSTLRTKLIWGLDKRN